MELQRKAYLMFSSHCSGQIISLYPGTVYYPMEAILFARLHFHYDAK